MSQVEQQKPEKKDKIIWMFEQYPPHVLRKIDEMIECDVPKRQVCKTVGEMLEKSNIKDHPSEHLVKKYLKYRIKFIEQQRQQQKIIPAAGGPAKVDTLNVEIHQQMHVLQNNPQLDVSNRRLILESVLTMCYTRMQEIERMQVANYSVSQETTILRYISEIRSLTETLLKVSGELQDNNQKIVINIVEQNVNSMVRAFLNIIMKYLPDKKDAIQKELKDELSRAVKNTTIVDAEFTAAK